MIFHNFSTFVVVHTFPFVVFWINCSPSRCWSFQLWGATSSRAKLQGALRIRCWCSYHLWRAGMAIAGWMSSRILSLGSLDFWGWIAEGMQQIWEKFFRLDSENFGNNVQFCCFAIQGLFERRIQLRSSFLDLLVHCAVWSLSAWCFVPVVQLRQLLSSQLMSHRSHSLCLKLGVMTSFVQKRNNKKAVSWGHPFVRFLNLRAWTRDTTVGKNGGTKAGKTKVPCLWWVWWWDSNNILVNDL